MKIKEKTIEMLVDWILEFKTHDVWCGNTADEIALSLAEDAKNGHLVYVLDDEVKFIGLVTFIPDRINDIVVVKNLLCTKHSALKILANHFNQHFNGYAIIASRRDKQVEYNTPRLIHHLLNMKGPE